MPRDATGPGGKPRGEAVPGAVAQEPPAQAVNGTAVPPGTPGAWSDEEARAHVARADTLLAGLDTLPSTAAAHQATETVEALVGLYGECLARIMHHLDGAADRELPGHLAADELVGHLLLVHDLHPDPVDVRVRRAVRQASVAARAGDDAAVEEVADGRVRVRLAVSGCGSTASAREQAVRDAIAQAAPEIAEVVVERGTQRGEQRALIPVNALFSRSSAPVGCGP